MPNSKGRQIVTEQRHKAELARTQRMLIYLLIGVLLPAVLIADFMTPLGIAIWLFYLFPITLALFLRNRLLPLALAATCTVFMLVTLVTDDPGVIIELEHLVHPQAV